MSASQSAPRNGSAALSASPGKLERQSFRIIKLDTPKGHDLITAMARDIDRLHSRLDKLFAHFGIEE